MIKVFTIGFTGKSAETFFTLLRGTDCKRMFDVRLNNSSQLAGYAKRNDLRFFLRELCNIDYLELGELAPEPRMLKDYRDKTIPWTRYEDMYLDLLRRRAVEKQLSPDFFNAACLLCAEPLPHQCHRRVALDYLNGCWGHVLQVEHLV